MRTWFLIWKTAAGQLIMVVLAVRMVLAVVFALVVVELVSVGAVAAVVVQMVACPSRHGKKAWCQGVVRPCSRMQRRLSGMRRSDA